MQLGAFDEILEQGFEIREVTTRDNRAQLRVDKESKLIFLILKHQHD